MTFKDIVTLLIIVGVCFLYLVGLAESIDDIRFKIVDGLTVSFLGLSCFGILYILFEILR